MIFTIYNADKLKEESDLFLKITDVNLALNVP